ncbi:MAG TPA: FkbM family methyltransferase, partial [Clostridia bacterium]|nr:FkbM family methyltransferase [Clostridia bacterium]
MEKLIKKQLPGGKGDVFLRPGSSDEALFHVLIDQDEYGYVRFLKEPEIIVDVGANIGLSSVCFAIQYPLSKIYAIEPASDNYEMLKKNTQAYPNITPILGALMGSTGYGKVVDVGKGDLAYQVQLAEKENSQAVVPCFTMQSFLGEYGLSHVDFLKIDIEGAEKEVFNASTGWLSAVSVLIIELHERFQEGCNEVVFKSISPYFSMEWIGGENYYFASEGAAVPFIPSIFKGHTPERLPVEKNWLLQEEIDIQDRRFAQLLVPLYKRVDALEGIYQRVDALENLYKRVDALEGIYQRVDALESLHQRMDEIQDCSDRYRDTLQEEICLIQQALASIQEETDALKRNPIN